jgi:orotate phosphoribosyltransferase
MSRAVRMDHKSSPSLEPSTRLAELRSELANLILKWGHERRDEPFQLSSAGFSRDYIDGKQATSEGERLKLVAEAIDEVTRIAGVTFDAIGGPTVGADAIAVAVAITFSKGWFFVRKLQKEHGKQKLIEGRVLQPDTPVVLVDDVATTGGSILKALDAVAETGANVVMVIPLVDRGDITRPLVEGRGIKYEPLLTYEDLGIDPVG